jgi:putative ATP-binding cassette transporter
MARPGISSIRLENISFTYTDHSGAAVFTVGPFDLTLEAGQILFVAGGNGSGKSTFLKLLTGLYPHSSGSIEVDGATTGIADYRALFSTVFTDFHLFDQLYGVPSPDPQRVEDLLRQLRLGQKAAIVDNAFSTTKLSTGQRKRLALIAAVLEDRPVIIFDEWTADQDPEFRETFYKDLLPQLRREGRTVIAVTHDDRYFKYCNRLITMQDGRITGDEAFAMDHSSTS